MAKYLFTLISRPLSPDLTGRLVSEVLDVDVLSRWREVDATDIDYDITISSDADRHTAVSAYDTGETVLNNQAGAGIAGTRTGDTVFTRTAGTWTASSLKGYYVYSYVGTDPFTGTWNRVLSNTTSAVTITGTLHAAANTIKLVDRAAFKTLIQIVPQEGIYGRFFQYRIDKKIPTTGDFKFDGCNIRILKTNIDPEFIAGTGAIANGWES
jgi:hypothetical protein